MKNKTYTQVLLNRKMDGKWVKMCAWVPTEYSRADTKVVVEGEEWRVVESYATFSEAHVKKNEKDFRNLVDI